VGHPKSLGLPTGFGELVSEVGQPKSDGFGLLAMGLEIHLFEI
jgi:hypothetical protein